MDGPAWSVEKEFEKREMWLSLRFAFRIKRIVAALLPIIGLPILAFGGANPESRCAYMMWIVIHYWVFQLLPLPISSLVPIVLCPLLGILKSDTVCNEYMRDSNMVLLTGMATAIALEYCNLHRRCALLTLMAFGTKPRWLLAGFMVPSAFLSMWINNTATCAMMIPIADSILTEMYPTTDELVALGEAVDPTNEMLREKEKNNMRYMIMLGLAWSCTLGGISTLTGSGTNLIFAGLITQYFKNRLQLMYIQWMAFAIPLMVFNVVMIWLVLQVMFLGFKETFTKAGKSTSASKRARPVVRDQYKALGSMSYHEWTVGILFIILIVLWCDGGPGIPGWKRLFFYNTHIGDSTAPALILILMFILPSTPDMWSTQLADREKDNHPTTALIWPEFIKKVSWGVLLVMGGAFAMSQACNSSGLCHDVALEVENSAMKLSASTTMFLTVLVCVAMTVFTSNAATAAVVLPIVFSVGKGMSLHPFYLGVPATIACSYAFVLPVSTPPNALVFERSGMHMSHMVLPGMVVAIVNACLLTIWMLTFGQAVFDLTYNAADYPRYL